jgi:hypothetical protein
VKKNATKVEPLAPIRNTMKPIRTCVVLATSLAILSAPARAHAQEGGVEGNGPPATVSVRSAHPGVIIGYVTSRGVAAANNGVVAAAVTWKNICTAPCSFQLPSGFQELVASGPGYMPASEQVELTPGSTSRFVVRPGSALVHWGGWTLTALGLTAAILGGTFAAIGTTSFDSAGNEQHSVPDWAIPTAIAGGVAMAGGIAMIAMSGTSIAHEGEETSKRSKFYGVAYAGKF